MEHNKKTTHHRCHDCANAQLIRWADDPLIAQCRINGLRLVASTVTTCQDFKQRTAEPQVEHRKKRIGITDIYI